MYFLKEYRDPGNDAGSKARIDCEQIFVNNALLPLDLGVGGPRRYKTSYLKRTINTRLVRKGSTLVIQYPFNQVYYLQLYTELLKCKKKKNIKIIVLIHDLLSLRNESSYLSIKEEINLLNSFDVVISHNKFMSKWLKTNGVITKIIDLKLFDYLNDEVPEKTKTSLDFKKVYFAGNLSSQKSAFLYTPEFSQLSSEILLFGPNLENIQSSSNVKYIGSFKPEELQKHFNDGFGLIWDGESVDTCSGSIGEYLKYNNPHKTSLYLSCGLPVIIWKESAMAKFIEEYNLGFTINSLDEIDSILSSITNEEYMLLKKNCNRVKHKVLCGAFLTDALKQAKK